MFVLSLVFLQRPVLSPAAPHSPALSAGSNETASTGTAEGRPAPLPTQPTRAAEAALDSRANQQHVMEARGLNVALAASKLAPAGGGCSTPAPAAAAAEPCSSFEPYPPLPALHGFCDLQQPWAASERRSANVDASLGAQPAGPTAPAVWQPGLRCTCGEKVMPCGLTASELEALVPDELLDSDHWQPCQELREGWSRQRAHRHHLPEAQAQAQAQAQPQRSPGQQPLPQQARGRQLLEHAAVMPALQAPAGTGRMRRGECKRF